MNAMPEPRTLRTLLSRQLAEEPIASLENLGPILNRLVELDGDLDAIESALHQASDVSSALSLIVAMMDAAYDKRVDADQVRCLLEPLQAKLNSALEEIRLVF